MGPTQPGSTIIRCRGLCRVLRL